MAIESVLSAEDSAKLYALSDRGAIKRSGINLAELEEVCGDKTSTKGMISYARDGAATGEEREFVELCATKLADQIAKEEPKEPESGVLKEYVIWFGNTIPMPVLKTRENGIITYLFYYSLSEFEKYGISEEEIIEGVKCFIADKNDRTVLTGDIDNYEILNLDTDV